jgi:hypothetical protein
VFLKALAVDVVAAFLNPVFVEFYGFLTSGILVPSTSSG